MKYCILLLGPWQARMQYTTIRAMTSQTEVHYYWTAMWPDQVLNAETQSDTLSKLAARLSGWCRQVYDKAQPGYRGRCTAPLLIDKKTKRIISNESPEILAALYKMQLPGSTDIDLVPDSLTSEAAKLKSIIYNQAIFHLHSPANSLKHKSFCHRAVSELWRQKLYSQQAQIEIRIVIFWSQETIGSVMHR